mgnify:FL=1
MLVSHINFKEVDSLTLEQLFAMKFDECHGLILLYKPLTFKTVVTNNFVIVIVTNQILVQNHMIFVYALDICILTIIDVTKIMARSFLHLSNHVIFLENARGPYFFVVSAKGFIVYKIILNLSFSSFSLPCLTIFCLHYMIYHYLLRHFS